MTATPPTSDSTGQQDHISNSAARPLAAWRDVDHRHRRFGFSIWLTGAEASIGRRLYRVRWAFRGR